jgi:hypothetical protein
MITVYDLRFCPDDVAATGWSMYFLDRVMLVDRDLLD